MKQQSPGFHSSNFMLQYPLIFILLAFLVGGCGASSLEEIGQPTPGTTSNAPVATAIPTQTMAPTRTPIPWQSLTNGSGLPEDLPQLSAENAGELQVLGTWGNGIAYDMQWSPDGETLAISTSRAILLVDTAQMMLRQRVEMPFPMYRIAFSDDGHFLYGGGAQGKLVQYDLTTDTLSELPLQETYPIMALAVAHTQPWLLAANWDTTVNLVDIGNPVTRRTLTNTLNSSKALAFSGEDDKFFTWSIIEPIKRWDLAKVKLEQEIYFGLDANQKTGSQVRFSADNLTAAANQGSQVRVQNLLDGTTISLLKDFTQPVKDLDISSDGAYVLTLHADQIRYWQSEKSKQLSQFSLAESADMPDMLRMARDGQHFVTLGNSLSFYTIDAQTNEITVSEPLPLYLSAELAYPAQFSDENTTVFPLLDGSLTQLNLSTGEYTFSTDGGTKKVTAATAGEEKLQALAFADNSVQIIDLTGETEYPAIRGLSKAGAALAISSAADVLAVQTGAQTSGLWQISSGTFLAKFEWDNPVETMQFSGDGRYLITSGTGKTQRYDLEQKAMGEAKEGRFLCASEDAMLLETYPVEGTQLQWVTLADGEILQRISAIALQAAVNPQGTLLAISSPQLEIWDLTSGENLLKMENPAPGAQLRFTPDGKTLLLIRADSSVMVMGVLLND